MLWLCHLSFCVWQLGVLALPIQLPNVSGSASYHTLNVLYQNNTRTFTHPSTPKHPNTTKHKQCRFIFSPEGTFFRSFLLDEVVKSIDALSREQLVVLVSRLGLQVCGCVGCV